MNKKALIQEIIDKYESTKNHNANLNVTTLGGETMFGEVVSLTDEILTLKSASIIKFAFIEHVDSIRFEQKRV